MNTQRKYSTQDRLKELLEEKKLKQVDLLELAKPFKEKYKINLSRSTISEYLSGKSRPDQNKIFLLAKIFDVSEGWLLGYDVPKYKTDDETTTRLEQIKINVEKMTIENQEKTLDYTEQLLNIQNKTQEDEVYYNYVPFYGYASAGTGQPIYDTPIETIKVKGYVPMHDLALLTSGDSMEPLYKNGDVIFINKTPEVQNGQIGVFILDGECFVKKLRIDDDGTVRLVSLNKKYKDIIINEYSNFTVVGKVVM